MDLKRSIRCHGCGNELSFAFNGSLDLTQLSAVGKCPTCSRLIQIDFAVVEKIERETTDTMSSTENFPNVEDALKTDEIPSGLLKNLME
ncbi:MAG: hypothetical protein QXT45_01785 [Candidatus Bilamarchaeaceae archaeon]